MYAMMISLNETSYAKKVCTLGICQITLSVERLQHSMCFTVALIDLL